MKSLNRAIDRFCNKHRGFGIPRLMLYIVIATGIVFLVGGAGLRNTLAFHPGLIFQGQIWRLFTWIFIPTGAGAGAGLGLGIFFTLIMLYFYYFIGSTLEREWGVGKFTIYYLIGMLIHIVYGLIVWLIFGSGFFFANPSFLNPMFLNLSMFFAFAVLFPDFTIRLFLIIPIKIKWVAIFNAVFFSYSIIGGMIAGQFIASLLPLVAFLNFFLICGNDLLSNIRPLAAKSSPQTINFRQAAKKAKKDLADKPYRHKCAVCGKTDTEFPNMEFRYCSHCSGYHCFCDEHINSHIHFD
ncbi:MAG: hypothetical protein FWC20_01670 [Oscillospiraceae bacterium]|nr:hypothetical protein [Oscillospiraceae bacterium]MCL2278102.1 hypothetical protein [Oscillospiraceae bacterium]